jgi:hypothetical protein
MALRDKLHKRAEPFMEPGEQIREVFLAQSGPNPNLTFLTWLVVFFTQYRVVAVTDRAIVVLAAPRFRPSFPKSVVARLDRNIKLGPPAGGLWSPVNLPGDKPTYVHRRFYKDVEAADAAMPGAPASP